MAYEIKNNSGSMFRNDKQNDRQPDYKGRINIDGRIWEIAAWNRTSQGGKEYISLSVEEPRQRDNAQNAQRTFQRTEDIPDRAAAQRLEQARRAMEETLDPQDDDLPF